MEEINGFELPDRKAEYLKIVGIMGGCARTTEISRRVGVAPSTATKTLLALAGEGYLEHTPYYGVVLTEKGERYARFLVRRHRVVSLALSRFGLTPAEACREANVLEGRVSKHLVDQICASFGHPVQSVCGPIEHDVSCCPDAA